jgi:hypothetical protein
VEQDVLFRRQIAESRVEIAGVYGEFLGSIYYQSPNRQFEQGGFDLVLEVATTLLSAVPTDEPMTSLFVASFEPVVPDGSPALEAARGMFDEYRNRLSGKARTDLGYQKSLSGVWLGAAEGLALFRELAPRCAQLSAEESRLRWLLLEAEDGKAGWDLLHEHGATHLGRWDENIHERPGAIPAAEASKLQVALDAAVKVLQRRLDQG